MVTGGSRGLGREMVLALAARGADVIIVSRKLENCEAVAAQAREFGVRALALSAHVGRWEQCDALLDAAYAEFGRIDILVNNAGMSPACPSHEVSEKLFDAVLNLNFKGPFRLASQVAQRMAAGEGGSIVNISSTGALMALPGVVPYGAAKAALNAMTVSLAKEYAPSVRVNTVSAGPFMTEAHGDWTDEVVAQFTNAAARPGDPVEIVGAVLLLASSASAFTTGAILRVDGGQRG
ncbi:SDR family NAD(P)-dependent oxidoreductase [Mangrovimicrobium sediminis]|uniref:SDR family NAD(P)-dependent oxidoreductase n=1 Tax=Mangrovimicrobium sediminis TaxID=2562682 RepID=UPI0023EF4F64|nr:SDR family oxidoreductase [Haliea sp. SAOS-164]